MTASPGYTDQEQNKKLERFRNRLEVNNALILSIATLAITWCSYQTNLWNGIQTFKLAESNLANRHAQEKQMMAMQMKAMDETVVVGFVKDVLDGKIDKVKFSLSRIRPELGNVLKSWLDSDPLHNPDAPAHPMVTPEYGQLFQHELSEAEQLIKQAGKLWEAAQQANTYADTYSLFTVVFSMIMFLGAITSRLTRIRLSFIMLVVSGIVCILVLAALFFSMPIATKG